MVEGDGLPSGSARPGCEFSSLWRRCRRRSPSPRACAARFWTGPRTTLPTRSDRSRFQSRRHASQGNPLVGQADLDAGLLASGAKARDWTASCWRDRMSTRSADRAADLPNARGDRRRRGKHRRRSLRAPAHSDPASTAPAGCGLAHPLPITCQREGRNRTARSGNWKCFGRVQRERFRSRSERRDRHRPV